MSYRTATLIAFELQNHTFAFYFIGNVCLSFVFYMIFRNEKTTAEVMLMQP